MVSSSVFSHVLEKRGVSVMSEYLKTYEKRVKDAFCSLEDKRRRLEECKAESGLVHIQVLKMQRKVMKMQYRKILVLLDLFRIRPFDSSANSIVGFILRNDFKFVLDDEIDCMEISSIMGYISQVVCKISDILTVQIPLEIHFQCSTSTIATIDGRVYPLYVKDTSIESLEAFYESVNLLSQALMSICSEIGMGGKAHHLAFLPNLLSICPFLREKALRMNPK